MPPVGNAIRITNYVVTVITTGPCTGEWEQCADDGVVFRIDEYNHDDNDDEVLLMVSSEDGMEGEEEEVGGV